MGLPTIGGPGLYFVAVDLDEPTYAWLSLAKGHSGSRTAFFDRTQAATFLRKCERDGYGEELLSAWGDEDDPCPTTLRAALRRTRRPMGELRAHPGHLELEVDGDPDRGIKRAVLAALP